MTSTPKIKKVSSRPEKIELPKNFSGLARTHRIINIEKHKEYQFLKICAQIRLNDVKQLRADYQRDQRREKRIRNKAVLNTK
jgi:hypothetical protein